LLHFSVHPNQGLVGLFYLPQLCVLPLDFLPQREHFLLLKLSGFVQPWRLDALKPVLQILTDLVEVLLGDSIRPYHEAEGMHVLMQGE